MGRRKPHDRCVVCDRTLEQTGGARLVATGIYSISICNPQMPVGSIPCPAHLIRLECDFRDVIVAMTGSKRVWTLEVIERVRHICQNGFRPWFCQKCVRRDCCQKCGTPMTAVPGADHMLDSGKVVHSPFFMGFGNIRRCLNPQCESDS